MPAVIKKFPLALYKVTVKQHLFTTYVFPATSEKDAEKYAERITNDPAVDDDSDSLMLSQWTSQGETVRVNQQKEDDDA
tara:strand:+ start:381 stop:617 length:237 start_codon:yes stop_codon:yes gene_type:complete